MDPRMQAIQQALQNAADPTVMAAIQQYAATGVPPTDPNALAALNATMQANGLPPLPTPAGPQQPPLPNQAGDPNAPGSDPGQTTTGPTAPSATPVAPATPTKPPATGGGGTQPNPMAPQGVSATNATNAILSEDESLQLADFMRQIGFDPARPGLYGRSIASTVMPYLQAFMKTDKLAPGSTGAAGDNVANRLGQLVGMFNGDQGFYGQLQAAGNALGGGAITDKLQAVSDPKMQQDYLRMIANLTSAGANQLTQQGMADQFGRAETGFRLSALDAARGGKPVPNSFVQYLTGKAKDNNDFNDIIALVTGRR